MDWIPIVISGVAGALIGLIPKIVDALKARKGELRIDKQFTYTEQRQLLADLRIERDIIHKEIDQLRLEYNQCLERAARQEEEIIWLNKIIEQQQKDIEKLKARDGQD